MLDNNLIKLGNYKPSKHFCGNIYDPLGIAPTVMENHGCVAAILINAENLTHSEKVFIVRLMVERRNGKE